MYDPDFIDRLDQDARNHVSECRYCASANVPWGGLVPDWPSDQVANLCDEGRRLRTRAVDGRSACSVCGALLHPHDWNTPGEGTFKLILVYTETGSQRIIYLCGIHLGAMAKALESQWPWASNGDDNGPYSADAHHPYMKWSRLVQAWFMPFFRELAAEVAKGVGGIFKADPAA